jgi:hypothetical protein
VTEVGDRRTLHFSDNTFNNVGLTTKDYTDLDLLRAGSLVDKVKASGAPEWMVRRARAAQRELAWRERRQRWRARSRL